MGSSQPASTTQSKNTKFKHKETIGKAGRALLSVPSSYPKGSIVAALLVALVGIWIFAIAHAGAVILASEDFSKNAANFTTVVGGVWSVSGGVYQLRSPAAPPDSNIGNANYAIHKASLTGDFTEEVDLKTIATASPYDDASVIFNWAGPQDYMYASFNEQANAMTNGLFVISGGHQVRLINFSRTFASGQTYHIKIDRAANLYTVQVMGATVATTSYGTSVGGRLGLGARNNSADFDNFVVSIPGDNQAPSVPGGLVQANTSTNSIQVAWRDSTDNIGVNGYQVYLDGKIQATITGTSYTFKSLKPNTSYSIAVAAIDASGNLSSRTTIMASTTTAQPADVTAGPLVSNKPTATNTGVPVGTMLTHYSGDLTITRPGTIIDSLDISGIVKVQAANVTIKNSIIRGGIQHGNTGLVNAMAANVSGLLITDCTLIASNPSVWIDGVFGHDFTARHLNISQVVDGFGVFNPTNSNGAANVDIETSYVHSLSYFTPDPNHSDNHTHNDDIQIQGNSNIRIYGNTLLANVSPNTGVPIKDAYAPSVTGQGVALTPNTGAISGVTIVGNWIDFGSQSITVIASSGRSSSATIMGNYFGRNQVLLSKYGSTARRPVLYDSLMKMSISGNVYEDDGSPITIYSYPNAS